MDLLVVGAPARGRVDLDRSVAENLGAIAASLNRQIQDLTVVLVGGDGRVGEIRETGARIRLSTGGEVTAAIGVAIGNTGVHAVMGSCDAATGLLAAAGVRCIGGEMVARSHEDGGSTRPPIRAADIVPADRLAFVATGVSGGALLRPLRLVDGLVRTHSLVMTLAGREIRFADSTRFSPVDSRVS
jgi:fructose-1,6-bisphosphatase II